MKKYIILSLIAILFGNCNEEEQQRPKVISEDNTFERPYKLKILNEHEVQCTFSGDTVYLYFENAYKLSEETIVFIKK
jgi:hypothetical protein